MIRVDNKSVIPVEPKHGMVEPVRKALEAKLLSFGGERAVFFWPEPDAVPLIERGRLFTETVELRPGKRNRCHTNAARIWETAPTRNRIVTGYALSRGVWRQHSWAVRDSTLYETTVLSERYFGFQLDEEEALGFWISNLHIHRYSDVAKVPEGYWKRRSSILRLVKKVGREEQH